MTLIYLLLLCFGVPIGLAILAAVWFWLGHKLFFWIFNCC